MRNDEKVIRGRLGLVLPAVLLLAACPGLVQGQSQQQAQQQSQQIQQEQVQQEQIVRDPQALALLQKAWGAMGGSYWTGSGQLSGTTDVSGKQPGTFTVSVNTAAKTSGATFTDGAGNVTSYSLNDKVLTLLLPQKAQQLLPLHKALNLPPYFLLDAVGKALADTNWSVILVGPATVNSIACTEITIKRVYLVQNDPRQILSKFTERHVYIDPSSGDIVRIAYKSYSNNNIRVSMQRTLDYADYNSFGSYVLPSSITDSLNGQAVLHLTVTAETPSQ